VWNTGAVTAPASTTTPLALDLHHASFSVRDLAASLAFYEGVLGLTRLPRPEMRVEGVWLGVGSGQIHLITYDDELGDVGRPPARTNPAAQHVALRVADQAATVAWLEQHGLDVVQGRGQCWVQDPDGHVIEFIAT
jgi:glyoxylase I family protein